MMRISFISGLSEKQICKLNNLTSSNLVEGQVLTLPKFAKDKKKKSSWNPFKSRASKSMAPSAQQDDQSKYFLEKPLV